MLRSRESCTRQAATAEEPKQRLERERGRERTGGGTTNPNNIERIFKYAAAEELALNGSKRDRQRRREGEE